MAILKHGINGPFSGKVGNIVGYQLNGQNVIRSLSSYTKRKPTELTLINRGRMKAVSQFLRPIKNIIAFGYKHVAPAGSRVGTFQAAQSHTFKHAIAYGEGNIPYVNPENVLVFRGNLMPPSNLEAIRQENGIIRISWNAKKSVRGSVLLVLAYMPAESYFLFEEGGIKSEQGSYDWFVGDPITAKPEIVHIYAGFYDIVRDELSDSVYVACI